MPTGPLTLTFATRVSDIDTPSDLAERLPKALIHHNVPGQPVHEFLRAFDAAWAAAAGLSTFGPRQRWVAAVEALAGQGWPLVGADPVAPRRGHGAVVSGVRSVITATRSGRKRFVSVLLPSQWNDSVRDRRDAGGERDGGPAHHR